MGKEGGLSKEKDVQMDTKLNNDISKIIKVFENKIILNTEEYKNLVYFKEMYSILKHDFDKNLRIEINNIENSHRNETARLNKIISELTDERVKLREQLKLVNDSKNKKRWLW